MKNQQTINLNYINFKFILKKIHNPQQAGNEPSLLLLYKQLNCVFFTKLFCLYTFKITVTKFLKLTGRDKVEKLMNDQDKARAKMQEAYDKKLKEVSFTNYT